MKKLFVLATTAMLLSGIAFANGGPKETKKADKKARTEKTCTKDCKKKCPSDCPNNCPKACCHKS